MLWPHYDTGSRSINRAIDRGVNRNYLTVRRISVSCASLFHNKKYTAVNFENNAQKRGFSHNEVFCTPIYTPIL